MSLRVRPAMLEDAAIISNLNIDVQKLHADALPWRFKAPIADAFSLSEATSLIAEPNYFSFIAEYYSEAIGYVVAEIVSRKETARHHAGNMIYVHQISVRPKFQKQGAGRALLDAVKAKGKEHGITLLALDTWAFNKEALAFFQSYGLVPYNIKLWNRID